MITSEKPEQLRGRTHDAAWCDELAAWNDGQAKWDLKPGDERVLERLRRSPAGLSAAAIAKAALGSRASRLSVEALTMTGLAIASRLCGQQIIVPTKANRFRLA